MRKKINWLGVALSISLMVSLAVSFRYAQTLMMLLKPIPDVCVFHQAGPYVDEYNQPREATEYEKGCDQVIEQREQTQNADKVSTIIHLIVWLGWHTSLIFWLKYWFAHRHIQKSFTSDQKDILQIFTAVNHLFSVLAAGVSALAIAGIVISNAADSGTDVALFAVTLGWIVVWNILAVLARRQGKMLNALFVSAVPAPIATTLLFTIFLLSRSGMF